MPDTATEQGPMPDGLGERFEALFEANGDGGGHAACVVARHFPWIDHWFPEWTHRVIRPMLAVNHPLSEAVWHGFAVNPRWPSRETQRFLCGHLMAILKRSEENTSELQSLMRISYAVFCLIEKISQYKTRT